jgi:hypothetical protein
MKEREIEENTVTTTLVRETVALNGLNGFKTVLNVIALVVLLSQIVIAHRR